MSNPDYPGILSTGSGAGTSQQTNWTPRTGPAARSVIRKLPEAERPQLERESLEVLSECLPPQSAPGRRTGLIIGYVQSGKTLSFTTVSALAHDNGYRLVIVIAGVSTNLLDQSTKRLSQDLEAEGFWGKWQLYRSDDVDLRNGSADQIRADLQRWDDPDIDEDEQRTVLITVMKERAHLDRLIRILRQLDLSEVPALVIDDEADQASLNIGVRNGAESSTYSRVLQIRELLPRHTFLQYTATPQALLLINLIDQLSPEFGKVLTPGASYTGGQTFFRDGLDLIKRIPPSDIPSTANAVTAPPDSFLDALRLFYVGVAAGMIGRYEDARNRSMMIHPAQRTDPHTTYAHWARIITENWGRILGLDVNDPDRLALVNDFQSAHNELTRTAESLPQFDNILRRLPRALRETRITAMNSVGGAAPVIDWRRNYAWILVGGQLLDRGFTVEGLTVTYMPRGLGVGNADTVQQRARWFGYKAEYLGYCRVFLPDDVSSAFSEYVDHEEDVRRRLIAHSGTRRPLKVWKRAFLLSGALNPTRRSVLGHAVTPGNYEDRWFSPRSPHVSTEAVQSNRNLLDAFIATTEWVPDRDDPELLDTHRHHVAREISLQDVRERLLLDFTYAAPKDSLEYTGILLQIDAYLEENPDATCSVYRMRPSERTARGTDEEGAEIGQLFQGAYPVDGDPKIYPGDRGIRPQSGLAVQIHEVDIYRGPVAGHELIAERTPILAIWVPSAYSAPWVVQQQPPPA